MNRIRLTTKSSSRSAQRPPIDPKRVVGAGGLPVIFFCIPLCFNKTVAGYTVAAQHSVRRLDQRVQRKHSPMPNMLKPGVSINRDDYDASGGYGFPKTR